MRIRELQIDGFAALQGVNVSVDAPLTVIAGPNEAGKSSLHRFIRSMLYGFANRGQPVERGEPIYGGRHGGRLLLSDGERDYVLERYGDVPNRRGGQAVSLRDPDGIERPLTQAELERLWLGGISEKLFRQLFAVTLDELHELRALQGEEAGNYLYHAGMAGGASLASAIKTISSEMEKLYKPKGELPELNKLLEELKEAEAALRQSRKGIGPYNEAVMELKAIERELSQAEERLPARQRELAAAQSAAAAREDWLRIEALRMEEAELARELPNPEADPLPEHAEVKWESLVSNRAAERSRLQGAADEKERLDAERQGLSWQEELVRRLPELEALEARRESVAARREERAELAADIRLLDESIASMLGRLSADWREADLQAFASLPERERARRLQAGMEEAERKLEKTMDELGRLDRQIALRLEEMREPASRSMERQLESSTVLELLPRTKKELLAAWNELEDARRAWERAEWERKLAREAVSGLSASGEEGKFGEETLPSRTGGLSRQGGRRTETEKRGRGGIRPWLSAAAIALAAAAVGLPLAAGKPAGEAAGYYLLGAGLAAFAVYAAWPKGASRPIARPEAPETSSEASAEARRTLSEAQLKSRESELRFEAAAAALFVRADGLAAAPDDASWQAMRMAVQERVGQLELEEREQEAVQERERHLASLRRERERLERERDADRLRYETERTRWTAWLEERKLSLALPPELLPELFQLAEQALQAYRQRARAQERAAQLLGGEEAFEAAAAELFAACPPPAAAGGDTLLAVQLLHAEALRQRELAAEASRLDERLKQASAAFEAAREAAAALDAAVRAALDAAGEADEA
ncbi:AAA family ATPase, partial [Cohnella thailandensis]